MPLSRLRALISERVSRPSASYMQLGSHCYLACDGTTPFSTAGSCNLYTGLDLMSLICRQYSTGGVGDRYI